MPRKIVLDCDPGLDDAVAIMLAQGNPDVELLAVTTVGGNQSLEKVTRNALGVGSLAGVTAPVAAGADSPLLEPAQDAGHVHGESGLGGVDTPESTIELDTRHAVEVIVDTVMCEEPGTVTLVPVGPLTNIALAVRREPRIVERVAEVVLMGGAIRVGNQSPVAEFNIACDPEAAQIVFSAGWRVTMVGLDLTHQAQATEEVFARIAEVGGPVADLTLGMLSFYRDSYRSSGRLDHPPLHDPCAVAYAVDPDVMTTRRAPISVELTGTLTRGMTVADLRLPADESCPTQVAEQLDVDRFWNLVLDALHRVAAAGPTPAPGAVAPTPAVDAADLVETTEQVDAPG
ncbi:uridine-preferring nucleoside hydrolase UriH [Mobilicoccus pelagius]|uniref:Pyrimidine-specific ribonucleoside hydrolase RihB n=1 Tax=Mobilicoccus pelagius NBRC 104925 TaxID=1089455 RepID=H5UR37_9MICO|nr:nucleoside hydrolase [Mobilicoccus pelagius]GAB48195.1 pyrimidine-specific ribonucleoside hydrolase RihB [Mobilicoccus pelagius NBRC 104925]